MAVHLPAGAVVRHRERSWVFVRTPTGFLARPVTVLPLGRRHRRWEWAMLPGETVEDLERPETAWRLLADWNVTPEDAEIETVPSEAVTRVHGPDGAVTPRSVVPECDLAPELLRPSPM